MSLKSKGQDRAMRQLEKAIAGMGPGQKAPILAGIKHGMGNHYDDLVKDGKVPQIENLSEFNPQLIRISRGAGITLEDFKQAAQEVIKEKEGTKA